MNISKYFSRYDPAGQSFLAAWNDVFRVIDYGTIIIFFAIFPFYVYVHKINDVKDREVSGSLLD